LKRILITNDDGFEADGLKALIEAVSPLGHVTVVAPASEKSACGHSITLTRPLRFIALDDDFYKLDDGTPSDCIYLALHSIFEDRKPDLVISGINRGSNMGEDITYSGTASAAMEATLHGIPAFAISQVIAGDAWGQPHDYALAKEAAFNLASKLLSGGFPLTDRRFLNVNIPSVDPGDCQGYAVTKAGYRLYGNDAHRHTNPRGEEYYWLGLHPLAWESDDGMSDFDAIARNKISLTPIKMDMTCHDSLASLKSWADAI
jgi:5'-nucleotidase